MGISWKFFKKAYKTRPQKQQYRNTVEIQKLNIFMQCVSSVILVKIIMWIPLKIN